MEIGLIGLPQSGKTTVFEAITHTLKDKSSKNTNIGISRVEDPRIDELVALFDPKKISKAEVTFVDIPTSPESLGKSQSISGEYLNILQRMDALVEVIRYFDNPAVPHIFETIDIKRDSKTLKEELIFSDLTIIDKRIERLNSELKGARNDKKESIIKEIDQLTNVKENLENNIPIKDQDLDKDTAEIVWNFQLLSAKPLLSVLNIDEDKINNEDSQDTISICAQIEKELAEMPEEDQLMFRESLGIEESGKNKLIDKSYALLNLISFFTVGPDEVKAWTITQGMSALEAAGQIHSDIQKGFIKAEVIGYQNMIESKKMAEAKKLGLLRLEGKEYLMNDGDIAHFMFNK